MLGKSRAEVGLRNILHVFRQRPPHAPESVEESGAGTYPIPRPPIHLHHAGLTKLCRWVGFPVWAEPWPRKRSKSKVPKIRQNPQETQGFSRVLVRPERFELPAFWSVDVVRNSRWHFPALFCPIVSDLLTILKQTFHRFHPFCSQPGS